MSPVGRQQQRYQCHPLSNFAHHAHPPSALDATRMFTSVVSAFKISSPMITMPEQGDDSSRRLNLS